MNNLGRQKIERECELHLLAHRMSENHWPQIDTRSAHIECLCAHRTHQICQIVSTMMQDWYDHASWALFVWKVRRRTRPNEPKHTENAGIYHLCVLNLILCLHKGLYSINSRSIHSSKPHPFAIRTKSLHEWERKSIECVRWCTVTEWKWKFADDYLFTCNPYNFRSVSVCVPHCMIFRSYRKKRMRGARWRIDSVISQSLFNTCTQEQSDCMSHHCIE